MSQESWRWQGRQYHQWFGHGTKPGDETSEHDFDNKIRALGLTAIAALPASSRRHVASTFSEADLTRLVTAMRAWIKALPIPAEAFAKRFFDTPASNPVAANFRKSAQLLAQAASATDLREATAAFVGGMQAVGLDRWRQKLAELATRAGVSPGGANIQPGGKLTLSITRVPYETAALDFDPLSVPMSIEAAKVDAQIRRIAVKIIAESQGQYDSVSRAAAGSMVHARFAAAINAAHIPGVSVEISFNESGGPARYGEKDSKRVDVIFVNPKSGRIEGIWDWKVGGARLTAFRARLLVEFAAGVVKRPTLPAYPIPMVELHVELVP